jgi:hypothetical protein
LDTGETTSSIPASCDGCTSIDWTIVLMTPVLYPAPHVLMTCSSTDLN